MSLLVILYAIKSAHACPAARLIKPEDVKFADIVVVGRIINFEPVENVHTRQHRQLALARSKVLREKYSRQFDSIPKFTTSQARFEIDVELVLHGTATNILTVTWQNSTFPVPKKMPIDPYFIALRKSNSSFPLPQGSNDPIFMNMRSEIMTVLQAPCSSAFILKNSGERANKVRRILSAKND